MGSLPWAGHSSAGPGSMRSAQKRALVAASGSLAGRQCTAEAGRRPPAPGLAPRRMEQKQQLSSGEALEAAGRKREARTRVQNWSHEGGQITGPVTASRACHHQSVPGGQEWSAPGPALGPADGAGRTGPQGWQDPNTPGPGLEPPGWCPALTRAGEGSDARTDQGAQLDAAAGKGPDRRLQGGSCMRGLSCSGVRRQQHRV